MELQFFRSVHDDYFHLATFQVTLANKMFRFGRSIMSFTGKPFVFVNEDNSVVSQVVTRDPVETTRETEIVAT